MTAAIRQVDRWFVSFVVIWAKALPKVEVFRIYKYIYCKSEGNGFDLMVRGPFAVPLHFLEVARKKMGEVV